jgi:hypothetical protein
MSYECNDLVNHPNDGLYTYYVRSTDESQKSEDK